MRQPVVEILYFEDCPNHEAALATVQRVADELGLEPTIELVAVPDAEAATVRRFLGSPTVRVDGRDVEPGSQERHDFGLSCRVYRHNGRLAGQPDEAWMREALTRTKTEPSTVEENGHQGLPPRAAAALAAAEIPPSKLGAARRARLGDTERALYFWILRRFATSGRPSGTQLRDEARRIGLDPDLAIETLAREDLVHLDQGGEIAVAYPFSGRPTGHKVRFPTGHEVSAMCAIDALGIAPMFDQAIQVASQDLVTGEAFRARILPDGTASWEPGSAVIVAGVLDRQADSCSGCCPALNFFATHANAERWLAEHNEVRGQIASIEDAIASGRAVFGDVFAER